MKEYAKGTLHTVRQMVVVTLVLLVICGFLYPVFLSGISTVLFPSQAKGSLITIDGKPVASEHVGQQFKEEYYLWSRPSAYNYNVYVEDKDGNQTDRDGAVFGGVASGSNNYGPSNPALTDRVKGDLAAFLQKNPGVTQEDIPADLLTASGSGLDPNISPESAEIQVSRIANASHLDENKIRHIIKENSRGKLLGIFGEDTVNVVKVNIQIGKAMGILSAKQ